MTWFRSIVTYRSLFSMRDRLSGEVAQLDAVRSFRDDRCVQEGVQPRFHRHMSGLH